MTKGRIIKRALVLAVLIFAVSALSAYTVTYLKNYRKDPLEGTWALDESAYSYEMVFKRGKMYVQVDMAQYSPMQYQILSVEQEGDSTFVSVVLSDKDNSYQDFYEIQNGDTMIYGETVLKKR
ncbi:MAG: hypothetical protein IKJ17_03470 [Clostridia bacterium]|nr:hypothetical protein [Clostridia bacterium]